MTGLRTRLSTAIGRAGVGLIAVVALAPFLAPTSWASPDTDADAAITQAWDAGGGPTGPLGIKDGGVYPIGAGFGQNFAGGKMFFTPDTGAHGVRGSILDKYETLGGPADGDLGFPTIDEGDGKAPGSRNTTFSAADKPVIFWTPDTGARVVRGAVNAAWDALGGSAGVLGVPSEDEVYRGDEVSQAFTGGQVTWNRKTKAYTTAPPELADQLGAVEIPGDVTTAIDAARRAAGGPLGPLGAADGDQYAIGNDGAGRKFAGGKIFYSPETGANVLTGQVLAKYESVGGPQGDLGFPTSNESDGGVAPASEIATFAAADQPIVFWTPDFGAVIVRGAMNAAWSKLGAATGDLGPPTADQTQNGDVVTQKFNGGAISWNKTTNQFTTEPPALASQLTGLQVPGREIPKPPAAGGSGGGSSWFHAHRWWLVAGVVAVLVILGVVAAAVLNRRRRVGVPGRDDDYDDYDDHYDHDDDYDGAEHDGADYDEGLYRSDFDDRHDDAHYDHDDHAGDHHGRGFDSGPVPVHAGDDADEPSGWVTPAGARSESAGGGPGGAEEFTADLASDQDGIDTAPTRIAAMAEEPETAAFSQSDDPSPALVHDEQEPALDDDLEAEPELEELEPDSGPPSGRHAAIHLDEPTVAEPSLRLAGEDSVSPPRGYPIKADTKSGTYWTPGSDRYERARAEIWFASEEFALTNGFTKG